MGSHGLEIGVLLLCLALCSAEEILKPEVRVIGGVNAEPHSAPFIASLFVRNREGLIPYCAGSILNENWVLTAAHCLVVDSFRIYIVAGHHNISQFENTAQRRRVDFAIQHEDFDQIGPYDIGLLHVSQPFQFTPQVQAVRLSDDADPAGIVTVFGWGSMSPTLERNFPKTLMTVNLTVVTNDYCESRFPVEVDDGNLCAGLPDGGRGACVGDSGGPIMQNGAQIGIISWGPQNCDPAEGPTVLTKVAAYAGWIRENLRSILNESEEDDDVDDYDDFIENVTGANSNGTSFEVNNGNSVQNL